MMNILYGRFLEVTFIELLGHSSCVKIDGIIPCLSFTKINHFIQKDITCEEI